ncbi:ubiquitin carboxyl-terminal hydrolase 34-like isoform X4 [Biomphalaria pfeifferi]|uniref:Ubiquitin carboxyl-terminal hydrolase 34-like isoform X4 n=1 Tax=Biomphalaria pfeifferi TaxID=112525 RepID=A0AAD8BWS5_BIOPF|nr:ubiquitin carboxyl-terminal hydrolase 34-like isoform X4 [Biomphalaria pfeifferi]
MWIIFCNNCRLLFLFFQWGKDDLSVMHRIYQHLLLLLKSAHVHIAPYDSNQTNLVGPSHAKLMSLFSVLNYCLYSRREKLMFTPYFMDLWQLFHPFMLESSSSQPQQTGIADVLVHCESRLS